MRLASRHGRRAWHAALAVGTAVAWLFERVEVHGTSMTPTFDPGDRLLLVRRYRPLRRGDLVSLPDPRDARRQLVKRVVDVRADGVVLAGDNPGASTDSRAFGAVPASSIRHLVVRRYGSGVAP